MPQPPVTEPPSTLYGFGSNGNGQLGIGHDDDTDSLQPCVGWSNSILNEWKQQDQNSSPASTSTHSAIHHFAAGGNHSALITEEDRCLWMAGSNQDYECFFDRDPTTRSFTFAPVRSITRWRSVACGWAFTVGVAEPTIGEDGVWQQDLMSWGSGGFGELGLGPKQSKSGPKQQPIMSGALADNQLEIVQVKAGLRHVLALAIDRTTNTKCLLGWGNNRHGQIGFLLQRDTTASADHSGKAANHKVFEPARIKLDHRDSCEIVDMCCGQSHSIVLLSDGSVYASGLNKYGQLGLPPATVAFRVGFEQVNELPFVNVISCGWSHNAAMDIRDGRCGVVYMWGRSDHGQLGSSRIIQSVEVDTTCVPLSLTWKGVTQVDIPAGNNDGDAVCSLSCGSEHTLVATASGRVYAWGWNEHGNCGQEAAHEGGEDVANATSLLHQDRTDHERAKDQSDVLLPRLVAQGPQMTLRQRDESLGNIPSLFHVFGGYGSSWVAVQTR